MDKCSKNALYFLNYRAKLLYLSIGKVPFLLFFTAKMKNGLLDEAQK
jgi:hypothetical protein